MTQALQIIGYVFFIVCYGVMTFFAVNAWFRLRRMEKDINETKNAAITAVAVTTGEHLRQSFNEIDRMQNTLRSLVNNERYEEAERMKAFISKAEKSALRELHNFQERFGNDFCDVNVMNIPAGIQKEDEA